MSNMIQRIVKEIQHADIITLFRHINPDHDALGSQFGLAEYLQQKFPNKQIVPCGFDSTVKGISYPKIQEVSDETIENSLAIILDSANQERIDDQRFAHAKKIIKIDHHPLIDNYGDIAWVSVESASTCEMITEMLISTEEKALNYTVSRYLLAGIISDTIMFSIRSTTSKTLKMASYLMESGVDINELHQQLFHISLKEYQFTSFIRNKATMHHDSILVAFVSKEELMNYQMHPNLAKEYIYALANIYEVEVWALFIEIEINNQSLYNGSIRSKNTRVNTIATEYNGGGHALAAAVKHVTKQEAFDIINKIDQAIKEDHHEV